MALESHPDLKTTLVTIVALIVAWGPIFAAIAVGVAKGTGETRTTPAKRKGKSRR